MDVSIVIPCYRSQKLLQDLVYDLLEVFSKEKLDFEILLILDSRDESTQATTREIKEDSDNVRRFFLSRNFGQQAATAAGIVESSGSIIVTMDDDYQHSPLDVLSMVQMLQSQSEIHLVYGTAETPHQSFGRRFTSKLFRRLMKLAGIAFFDLFSPLRAFRGYFRPVIQGLSGPNVAIDVALSWVVSEVRGHPAKFRERTHGASNYSSFDRARLAFSFLLMQSTAALQWGIYLGFLGVVSAVVLGARTLYLYFADALVVSGFATTILVVLFLGSIQLISLGIIGKYIGFLHQRSLGQPAFLIERRD